jgi:phospholipid transport system substrate-binding protein
MPLSRFSASLPALTLHVACLGAACCVSVGGMAVAWAKDAPEARTQQLVAALQKQGASPDPATEQTLDALFDFDRLSTDPILPHRKALSPAQWKEFTGLFHDLIRSKALHAGTALNQGTLRIGPVQGDGKRRQVEVHVSDPAKDVDAHVTFTWEDTGAQWRVVDVELDGSSVVKDYENQFGRILKKDGPAGLITKMRTRLDATRKKP